MTSLSTLLHAPLTASRPSAATAAQARPVDDTSPEERALKSSMDRLQEMREALSRLESMPSPQEIQRQMAKERAETLKRLLQMLKQMLIGATPRQARAMAAQLKDIARQLASIGKTLSGGDSEATAAAASAGPAREGAVHAPAMEGEDAKVTEETESSSSVKADEPAPGRPPQAIEAYASMASKGKEDTSGRETDELRKTLEDALKTLRSLVAELRRKLGERQHKELTAAGMHAEELAKSLVESAPLLPGIHPVGAPADAATDAAVAGPADAGNPAPAGGVIDVMA